ncbi:ABC transporter substrate-binding protein [Cohnella lubricantis]|uniref:Amino acid ABC transporter substrate-binding protein n=1 Tax=Cohnella lubricantis TaxID=2163172 RepID=A0A841TDY4_9BACL|nr:ABC transporter substrate-binding protein [Cohnella lubricantis]MBB6679494.1 amino acid ABC transporter substrate-binding protein [Cohnella lubricantis]MBP2118760.1 ABC-type amino acid transport substrate-binding protein [Cohnella lubricantis]
MTMALGAKPFRRCGGLLALAAAAALLLAGCDSAGAGGAAAAAVAARPAPAVQPVPDPSLLPADLRAIIDKGELTVALYADDRYPFFYKNSRQELAGGDIDLATDIAHQLGVEPVFLRTAATFDEVVDQIVRGEADIAVSKLSVTLSRARKVKFTSPYLVLSQALLVNRTQLAKTGREADDPLRVIDSLGAKVGIRQGTSFVDYADNLFPDAEKALYDDTGKMVDDLLQGKLFAILYDENEIKRTIYDNPQFAISLKTVLLQGQRDPLAIAVAPDNDQLLYWLNLYLNLKYDGNLPRIDDWLTTYPSPEGSP